MKPQGCNAYVLLLGVFLLNISDTIATYAAVNSGYAYEANPIMAGLITYGGWLSFIIVKLTIAFTYLFINWKLLFSHPKYIIYGSYVVGSMYFAVNVLHVIILTFILGA